MDEGERSGRYEVELVADDRGLAVLGSESDVELFLASEGLVATTAPQLGLGRMSRLLGTGSASAQAASEVAAASGRWVKLTEESAGAVKKYGLRESSRSGLSTGVLKGDKGRVKGFVEFSRGPGTALTNPALLAGAAGIMAQLAMHQTMEEITDYLERIDAKLDDVLRAQKDSVVARLTGAGMVIDEAVTVSRARGRVDATTWSKVQVLASTVAEVQGYALAQLDGLAARLERATRASDVAGAATDAAGTTQEWLAVLARSFQLLEALDVLELDRVLDTEPEAVDEHRRGLEAARAKRVADIGTATVRLLGRIADAADLANEKVLLSPFDQRRTFQAGSRVNDSIGEFHHLLGLETGHTELEARRWSAAAGEVRDHLLDAGAEGVAGARRGGGILVSQTQRATVAVRGRLPRLRGRDSVREPVNEPVSDPGAGAGAEDPLD
ncbi:hypothetical protein [Nocardioides sp. GY 10127]|uniref:hypothetical protein n=1 Tax=Nocardioides sp. GY 10127 TaxID=2569762 RepID=UPI0010A7FF7F|nr:hypothetical protein [Nocardioides sp. GY 10127]TIC84429.1 hypothetical protein E8D37_06605 [Nocardioides sp. GY 10127]